VSAIKQVVQPIAQTANEMKTQTTTFTDGFNEPKNLLNDYYNDIDEQQNSLSKNFGNVKLIPP
jgi:hypothetical protein